MNSGQMVANEVDSSLSLFDTLFLFLSLSPSLSLSLYLFSLSVSLSVSLCLSLSLSLFRSLYLFISLCCAQNLLRRGWRHCWRLLLDQAEGWRVPGRDLRLGQGGENSRHVVSTTPSGGGGGIWGRVSRQGECSRCGRGAEGRVVERRGAQSHGVSGERC